MDGCHLLLKTSWKFDKWDIHDGKPNTYSFKIKGCSYTLTPLLPSQVQHNIKPNRVGNTGDKALFLIEPRVKRSVKEGKTVYTLFVSKKERKRYLRILWPNPLFMNLEMYSLLIYLQIYLVLGEWGIKFSYLGEPLSLISQLIGVILQQQKSSNIKFKSSLINDIWERARVHVLFLLCLCQEGWKHENVRWQPCH